MNQSMFFLALTGRRTAQLVSLLFLSCAAVKPVLSQCARQSEDKYSTPKFLSSYQANITRLTGCSTQVVESIEFPHNCGDPWRRDIQVIAGQRVNDTSILMKREGRPMNVTFGENYRIAVPAPQSDEPVRFDLSYTMLDGVTKYPGRCDFGNDDGVDDSGALDYARFNLLAWGLGEWEQEEDSLNVSVDTSNKNACLRFADGDGDNESGLQLSVSNVDVGSPVTFYVLEKNTAACTLPYECSNSSDGSSEL